MRYSSGLMPTLFGVLILGFASIQLSLGRLYARGDDVLAQDKPILFGLVLTIYYLLGGSALAYGLLAQAGTWSVCPDCRFTSS
jgi:hypothetical protein